MILSNQSARVVVDVAQSGDVKGIVQEASCAEPADQFEKCVIVRFSNAVVQPFTMMVESADAPVALTTMLRVVLYIALADFAIVFVERRVK